jgi:Zn-finger protein
MPNCILMILHLGCPLKIDDAGIPYVDWEKVNFMLAREGFYTGEQYFKNTKCSHFPCHEINSTYFNCLFCYCPLYHMYDCGGNFSKTLENKKDCSKCTIVHIDGGYDFIQNKLKT